MSAAREILVFDSKLKEERDFWLSRLSGGQVEPYLHLDYSREFRRESKRDFIEAAIAGPVYQALLRISGGSTFLIYSVLCASLHVTLHKHGGARRIITGSPSLKEAGNTNAVSIISDVDGATSFRAFLQQIREKLLEAYRHQTYPVSRLVRDLRLERTQDRCPLFDIVASFQGLHGDTPALRNDIAFGLSQGAEGIRALIDYDRSLYRRESIEWFLSHFLAVLERGLVSPEKAIKQIRLLSKEEVKRVTEEWSVTEEREVEEISIEEMYERQGRERPDAIGVSMGSEQISYGELNRKGNQLANRLRREGVGPEVVVGLSVEKSVEMIIGMLGIEKAGGAYVPLDGGYPGERLEYMMEESGVEIVVGDERGREVAGERRVIRVGEGWEEIEEESEEREEREGGGERSLAYVIYTSGSTGRPKGVEIERKGVGNLSEAQREVYRLGEEDRVLQYASLSFDASVAEIVKTVRAGARQVIRRREEMMGGESLRRVIEEEGITMITLTPSVLRATGSEGIEGLKKMEVAGEALQEEEKNRWVKGREIYNAYGPTETSVWASVSRCKEERGKPGIGRAILNVRLYVLDEEMEAVGEGMVGELYIGGEGVGRGYRKRAELTAESYVPDGWSKKKGGRMYRTGDLVRQRGEGGLEYIGRKDEQVKVRGYRIELGEIEEALREEAGVEEAAVKVEEEGGEKRLIGYVVEREGREIKEEEVRRKLRERLPEYMMISGLMKIVEMPVSESGKVDRKRLPRWERKREEGREGGGGESEEEKGMSRIVGELVGVEGVGMGENFFELGGHSLIATQMVTRIREEMGVEIGLRRVFEAKNIGELAKEVEEERRRKGRGGERKGERIRREEGREKEMSYGQKRIWFMEQMEEGSGVYNCGGVVRMKGRLEKKELERSIREIKRRHEVLRTRYVKRGEEVIAEVMEEEGEEIRVVDVKGLSEEERKAEEKRIAEEERGRGFELREGRLMRVVMIEEEEEEQVAVMTMHHIVSDGWSVGILVKELSEIYGRRIRGEEPKLKELEVQYGDYAKWQKEWLRGEVIEEQLSYWREQLKGPLPVLKLPADRHRAGWRDARGATAALSLPSAIRGKIEVLNHAEGCTLTMTMLAAFAALLGRLGDQDDIIIGMAVANRNRKETEGLIGLFLNNLAIRADLSGNPTFRELLSRIRQACIGAYDHQDVPFEKVVEEVQPERNVTRHPLFDIFFNSVTVPAEILSLPGLTLIPVEQAETRSKFAITVYLRDEEEQVGINLVYQEALFSSDQIACLLGQYRWLIEQSVADPDRPIQSYSLVTPDARALLPDPAVSLPEPAQGLVSEKVLSWARKFPDHPAVRQADRALSYRELVDNSVALARRLAADGLGAGDPVAIVGPRSAGVISGMLATLIGGGVLLTLDTALPGRRKRLMVSETKPKFLLRVGEFDASETWMSDLPLKIIDLDSWTGLPLDAFIQSDTSSLRLPVVSPDDPAYIFFTSGTTSIPKAVLGCHKGLSHFLNWQRNTFEIGPGDRTAHLTGLSFDVVLRDIFLPLTSGATIHLPGDVENAQADYIVSFLEGDRITVLHTVPALARSWLPNGSRLHSLSWLRCVFLAGEPLTDKLVGDLRSAFPGIGEVINLYGPTETTLAKCAYSVPDQPLPGIQPIGWPLPQTQSLVLNRAGELCGVQEPGEIVLRTPFRSLGYLNAPEDASSRFVLNHFRSDQTDFLYRTGDQGRYRADGCLEILGRLDNQVKIRGVRVEPDEITAVLCRHPKVSSGAVLARNSEQDETVLGAYVVTRDGDRECIAEIRQFLAEHLPASMIPSFIIILDKLPLGPNGKLDREALPIPSLEEARSALAYVPPRTPIEEVLAGIWAEVLGVEQVGAKDDFFELGGHSLLALQVMSRITSAFQVRIHLRRLFEETTLAGLARSLEAEIMLGQRVNPAPIGRVSRDGDLPLSFAQQRLWFISQMEPDSSAYNTPGAFRLNGDLSLWALEESLNQIVRRHETLRTTFVSKSGQCFQKIADDLKVELPITDMSLIEEAHRESYLRQIAITEYRKPFDLVGGPLIRANLLKLGKTEHVLMVTIHHIVSDGWSMATLLREIGEIYEAYRRGEASRLKELQIQYGDYAKWEREWLRGEVIEEQLSYWKKQLAGAPGVLNLRTDRPRGEATSHRGKSEYLCLNEELSKGVKEMSRREGATLFMTLLAGFNVVLSRWSGESDIVVGTDVANRNREEVEGLIGFFVNQLVLRTNLGGDPTFRELLGRVREVTLGAYAHQDLPFEKVVDLMRPERNLKWSPLFQVKIVLQNIPVASATEVSLDLQRIEFERNIARFDLLLNIVNNPQGLRAALEYSTDLYEPASAVSLLRHFELVLLRVVADPSLKLSGLVRMLEEADNRQTLSAQKNLEQVGLHKLKVARRRSVVIEQSRAQ